MTDVYKDANKKLADTDGQFRRKPSAFRSHISRAPGSPFPPEKDRYMLYINFGCPWAHRTNIVRVLKHLEEIIPIAVLGNTMGPDGWFFSADGAEGSDPKDPLYGFTTLKQLYLKADPRYEGRYLVPTLWDKKKETIVSNESSEIIRMFFTEFDELLEEECREERIGMLPGELRGEIDKLNEWVYEGINNGVYKTGFATKQDVYEEHVGRLFETLDRVEKHLGDPRFKGPFLFGEAITEADVRLYTTIVRFDAAYVTLFKCNLKTIREGYPRIHEWLRRLYWGSKEGKWNGAFYKTVDFDAIKGGYAKLGNGIVPKGPEVPVLPLEA
ncbi:MAG: hypothetical protein MMC23_009286 [Stictis urceolatum]|nr:hypothetical protein [Stictis urceolata]